MTFIQPYILKKNSKCRLNIRSFNISQTPKTAHKRKSDSLGFLIFLKFYIHQIITKIYIQYPKTYIYHYKNRNLQIQNFDHEITQNQKQKPKRPKTEQFLLENLFWTDYTFSSHKILQTITTYINLHI